MRILSSLKTTLLLAAVLAGLSAWGSISIQLRPEDYATIESGILLDWLHKEGAARPAASWWILSMIAVAGLLCLNTVVCAGLRLTRAVRGKGLTVRSGAAHAAHLGFLLVLGAHLVGALAGFRSDGHAVFSGQSFSVPQRAAWTFAAGALRADFAPQGYPKALEAALAVRQGDRVLASGLARVNHPVFAEGVAAYLTGVQPTLRGWRFRQPDAGEFLAEVGRPLSLPGGTFSIADWNRSPEGALALQISWAPAGRPARFAWLAPEPGKLLSLPEGPTLGWGAIAVDTLATFDVRYDPGAPLALAGGALLSASLLPLLWPRRRHRLPPLLDSLSEGSAPAAPLGPDGQ